MFEKVYSIGILYCVDAMSAQEYNDALDSLFLKYPESELLLELELSASDKNETLTLIHEHTYKTNYRVDYDVFGRAFFEECSALYDAQNESDLKGFCERMYAAWQFLPEEIAGIEPFSTLCYAGDGLSTWDSDKNVRKHFERAFSHEWKATTP